VLSNGKCKKSEKKQKQSIKLKDGESVAIILLALVVGYFFVGIIGAIVDFL
jgi:hypothetical protein